MEIVGIFAKFETISGTDFTILLLNYKMNIKLNLKNYDKEYNFE